MKLWLKILIGMFLGLVCGALIGPKAEYLKPVGQVFLNMISMLIVPLIFSSIAVGITSIQDTRKLGRVGAKTLGLYLSTTAVAICIGLFFAFLFKPGCNIGFTPFKSTVAQQRGDASGFIDLILNIIPSNAFEAFTKGNILQVIVFAVFLGLAIQFTHKKARPLYNFLESVSEVMYSLTNIVMKFAPIGVFAIMASIAGTFGVAVLIPLAKLLGTIYIASLVQFGVFAAMIMFLCRLNPISFFKGMVEAIVFAFSTSSSSASVPVTIHCVIHNLGVPKNIARFVVPLGSTINMNGTAIFQGISSVFIAQMYGIELSIQTILIIVVTATISAIGTAGIPGAGFLILSMVLKSAGLPLEGLAIIFAIDRLRDMVGTVVNIVGDAVVAVYVAKSEGELDMKQYDNPHIMALENSEM